jgi:phage replication-related protein YjqB (UPF0714/DUF867 family)
MRFIKLPVYLFLLLASGCSADQAALRRGGDAYPDFLALKAVNTEGLDYSREVYDRGSKVAVFAIHGGDIETATARVARRVAGKDLNLYIFNGWHGRDSGGLHVTAVNFDDPAAVRLATSSVLGLSIHSQADRGSWVCVGGRNAAAAGLVARRLTSAGFVAETPCPRLPGTSGRNLVNRPEARGVQLEITLRLLASLARNESELARFAEAVRQAALEFVSSGQTSIKGN